MTVVTGDPFAQRDPEFVNRVIPAVERYVSYFSPEVRHLSNLPASGPVLLVGNHSCLYWMPDTWVVARAVTRRRGVEAPSYALGYDLLFRIPAVGGALRRIGALPASLENGTRALADGALVFVYPGGDREASRPWRQRNTIDFSGRKGFVRLALRAGVPVVPVVAHGSHDAICILSRGERIADAIGLGKLRIHIFPIFLSPLGISTIFRPPLPLPSSITVEFLPALDWRSYGPGGADDPGVLDVCYKEITETMQAALDRLSAERRFPVVRGFRDLVTGHGLRFVPED